MKLRGIINCILIASTVVFLATLAFYVKTGATADSIAVLKTTGMTCGSCSSKITAALEKQKGVAVSEVDVEGGWVIVSYDTKTVTPWILAEKVSGAGFGSNVHRVLTPEQFKQITGREIGGKTSPSGGCGGCGPNGGCGTKQQS